MTILMVIHMCNKDDEDDADVDPKYSEEWTRYYALPLSYFWSLPQST